MKASGKRIPSRPASKRGSKALTVRKETTPATAPTSEEDDSKVLICAPATQPLAVPSSSFNMFCSKCYTRIMIAPSGQDYVKLHPDTVLVCITCHLKNPLPADATIELPTTVERVIAEARSAVPNFWSKRN